MSKKSIVNQIRAKLTYMGVSKDGCKELNIQLPNGNKIEWVGYNQVQIGVKIASATFRNKRYPIYSKEMTEDMLNTINNRLDYA